MSAKRRAEIRARLEAATQDEWLISYARSQPGMRVVVSPHVATVATCDTNDGLLSTSELEANAQLIAAAPTDLRVLLAENERLRRWLKVINKGLDDAQADQYCVGEFTARDLIALALDDDESPEKFE